MIEIGSVYLQRVENQTRLCADVSMNGRGTTLWFGVETAQEDYLCARRSDAFVMALLPAAMRGGHDIHCETPMSERLHYQLEQYLIPSLVSAGTLYHTMTIRTPLAPERVENKVAVGTGFSGGVDSLYSVMTHGADSDYPLTHLALFNVGVFEGRNLRKNFRKSCDNAQRFARKMGLELVGLDSNLPEALPERFLDVYSFRNLAGAMALQGLFSVYLLSSGHDVAQFTFDLHNSATYDLLTVHCAQTESLSVYLSGAQVQRAQKLAALAEWTPSHRWLHPCVYGLVGEQNCGHCKKCARDMTTLYALGALERYEAVFDLAAYQKALPQRLGFVLANRGNHLYDETLRLMKERNVPIPPAAYACEQQFRRAIKKLGEDWIHIGMPYIETVDGQARLCAQIRIGNRGTILWFGVEERYAGFFTRRADPFVVALLPMALRRGLDIRCDMPVTERLLHQLETYHIPTMAFSGNGHIIRIDAEAAPGTEPNAGAVGTGFTGGVDSLYAVMQHMPGKVQSGFALTHLTVLNVGAFKGTRYRENFKKACGFACRFADEQGLELVCIDTNFNEVLVDAMSVNGLHYISDEVSYRIFSAVLALNGLFSVYYLATDAPFRDFTLDPAKRRGDSFYYDLLVAMTCSTGGVTFYPAGGEFSRVQKLTALSDWEPSYRWLHACFTPERNCGVCKKCAMAQVVFDCLGKLERYAPVYDLELYRKNRESFLARALMNAGGPYEAGLEKLVRTSIPVTPQLERRARLLSAAVRATDTYFRDQDTDVPFAWK